MNANESLGKKCEIVNSNFATNIESISYTSKFVLTQVCSVLRHKKIRSFRKFMFLTINVKKDILLVLLSSKYTKC